eukprot:c26696_g3_i1 orf=193-1392(-)
MRCAMELCSASRYTNAPQNSALLFIALLLLVQIPQAIAAQSTFPLRFNSDGEFKILQVADMHYANGATTSCLDVLPSQFASCSDLNTTAFLNRMIAAERPDLIVFTGDNIYGMDCRDSATSLNASLEPAITAKLPWAAVLGNHDQEGNLDRQQVMQHIVGMDYTLSKLNPCNLSNNAYGSCSPQQSNQIDGFGNYNIEVGGVQGSILAEKSVLNLYFLDSGDYSTVPDISGYGWIKHSQQQWFKQLSAQLQAAYKSEPAPQNMSAPGLVYFHIPLPEFSEVDPSNMTGVKQEGISSPSFNSGFLTTMINAGDIKATFVGHDHINDFCGQVKGINLCYAGGFGYHAYGKAGWSRRSRVVLASLAKDQNGEWTGVNRISTWKRLDDDSLSTIDTQLLWSSS